MERLKFKGIWRSYQARVLEELETHLDDRHLHIVAAPGSGKTILGLEVLRRLGKPTLILAPTLTIRNQWVERLTSLFLPDDSELPSWISKNLAQPGQVTAITYQALHAAFAGAQNGDPEMDPADDEVPDTATAEAERNCAKIDVIKLLRKRRIETLVLDECHHLRKEWWKALTALKQGLATPTIVSLTATPPYDVDYREWQRYQELCGPIDSEISVPELVRQGDLCPHQDYVYFSLPTDHEARKLRQFKSDVQAFVDRLIADHAIRDLVFGHRFVREPLAHIEEILKDPEFFSSLVVFSHRAGFTPPRQILDILGARPDDIPALDAKWLEILLTGLLYGRADDFPDPDGLLDGIRRHLKRIGVVERRRVRFADTTRIRKLLASSLGKLDGILEIARLERRVLGPDLRMVVLTDYIRRAELPAAPDDLRPIDKIGVVPIFELIRRAGIEGVALGILTGSFIVIPEAARGFLEAVRDEQGIAKDHVRCTALPHDSRFLNVRVTGEQRSRIVHLITEVFNRGGITVLVGTQAMLGEGWDSPTVNSLVLASFVGSYMLSNQMRGRAIRIDPASPGKTANIWHLAAVDPESLREKLKILATGKTDRKHHFDPFDALPIDLGSDMALMKRRFRAFEGVSFTEPPTIENGFRRLGLSGVQWTKAGVAALSGEMLERAAARDRLADLWRSALQGNSPRPAIVEKLRSNTAPRALTLTKTVKFLLMEALLLGLSAFFYVSVDSGFAVPLSWAFAFAFALALPKTLKALWLLIRNGTLEGSVKQVGRTVLESLHGMDVIKTGLFRLKVRAATDQAGVVSCTLEGATTPERMHFLDAMREVLGPVDNPRYLLVRRSRLAPIRRVDYHAVPGEIGQNKRQAEAFARRWNRYVGPSELVYTRTLEGRKVLLRARTSAFSAAFRKKVDQLSVWE